jgi:hypothetical protein
MDRTDPTHRPDPRTNRPDPPQRVRNQNQRHRLTPDTTLPLFAFTQIEVPWPLGPPDGKYLMRQPEAGPDGSPSHVLVLATLGAAERRRSVLRRSDRTAVEPEPEPTPVPTGRATLIHVEAPLPDEAEAAQWLKAVDEDTLRRDLVTINDVLHRFRLIMADPYSPMIGRGNLLVARIGFGAGEQVSDGRWNQAASLELPRKFIQRRSKVLEPQARLAASLGGREQSLVCEELALRAQLDVEAGRYREAALQVLVALDAAIAELALDPRAEYLAERLSDLRARRASITAAAQTALGGALSAEQAQAVSETLARIEAVLRARAVANA